LQKEESISHFSLDEAIGIAQRVNPQTTYFTHIGHGMGFHNEVNAILPPNMKLAYDGLTITC